MSGNGGTQTCFNTNETLKNIIKGKTCQLLKRIKAVVENRLYCQTVKNVLGQRFDNKVYFPLRILSSSRKNLVCTPMNHSKESK